MATANPAALGHDDAHAHGHHELTFVQKYIFSTDHKIIGIQFLITTMIMLMVGGALALCVRWQLAFPWGRMPIIGDLLFASQGAQISPEFYTMLFTMHATVMIFLVIIPVLAGAFGNFLIPLQIGADDMAFPVLNMLSYWFMWPAIFFFFASFVVGGITAGPASGWTSYPVLSAIRDAAPGSGAAQTFWLLGLTFVGVSSMMGSVNYMTTIINMRAPGMTLFRMPLTIWSMFITAILQAFALPVLTAGRLHAALRSIDIPRHSQLLLHSGRPGHQQRRSNRRRWTTAVVAAPVLVLLAPGGLHHAAAGNGYGVGHAGLHVPQAGLWLQANGLFHGGDRRPGLHRLGPPYVYERNEPGSGHDVHDVDNHDCSAIRYQNIQLDWHDVGRQAAVQHRAAELHCLRFDVHHRRD